MQKVYLQPKGDGYVLEVDLDRQTVEDWKIDPEKPLEISMVGDVLALRPEREDRESFEKSVKWLYEEYGETLKRLSE